MDGYLRELNAIKPESFEEYQKIEKRRSCERLIQLSIEYVVDTCAIIVAGLRLGLPAEEDDIFDKLEPKLPSGVKLRSIKATEEPGCSAKFSK